MILESDDEDEEEDCGSEREKSLKTNVDAIQRKKESRGSTTGRRRRWDKKALSSLRISEAETEEEMGSFEGGQWEKIPRGITIDSGAAESVIPKNCCTAYPTREAGASKAGVYYLAANGEKVYNEGERNVGFATVDGELCSMTFQICNVTKPLGSVSKICAKGNRVVFDDEYSFIEHRASGARLPLQKKNGVYVLEAWTMTPPPQGFSRQGA